MANNNNICRNIDDDDDTIGGSTWASMSLAISDQGTCTKHPNVILREVGPDGFVYQKESCPECDLDFQNQKDLLKEQKRELDMQLEQLNNEEVSSHDEDDAEIAAPEPKNSSAQRGPSPFAPRFHVPPANDDGGGYSHPTNLSLESLANQMTMMQQMQDWMLQQKETEMATLRNKVEAQQKELLQKEVEIALLREKLSQQERRMHQEIKMAKLSAVASRDRKAEKESRKKGKGGNKEIHIQELHVQVGTNLGGGDGEFDPKVVQAATKAATTAALEKAAHAAEEHEERELQLQLQQAAATTASNGSGNSQPLVMKPPPTTSNRKEEDSDNSDFTKKKSLSKASSNMEFTFVPPGLDGSGNENSGKITGEEEFDEEESKDQFNPSSLPWSAPKLSKGVSSKKSFNNEIQFNPNTMTKNEPEHNNRTDPMRASMQSMAAPGTAGLNIGDTGLPTKKSIEEKNGNGPRGIPLELHYDDDNLDVPINEDVTIGTMDQQFFSGGRSRAGNSQGFNPYGSGNNFPMHNDDERSVGGMSLGNTVASSTYGEDRQKVVSQTLLDPYGDKGRYSGVVLRSTGMPHGLGRMVYEDDGRTYEGDWRHGRWHGFGRATFANGDSYEGEYRFDQRHGRGKYCWSDGRIYDGEFSEDKRHGKGTFKWPDGATYEGDFHQGQREGHGRYTFSDGGYYTGSWVDGRYEGFGECHWEDGRKYKGEWRAGMAHGQGVETYPDGRVRHDGQWIDDEPIRLNR